MRLSTVFVSSILMLAGITTTFALERESVLVARFLRDSDFLPPVEARVYHELELHARGDRRSYYESYDNGLVARGSVVLDDGNRGGSKVRKYGRPPKYKTAKDNQLLQYGFTRLRDKNWSVDVSSSRNHDRTNDGSGHRNPSSDPTLHELIRRRSYHYPSGTGANIPNEASGDRARNDNYLSNTTTLRVHSTHFHPPDHRYIL